MQEQELIAVRIKDGIFVGNISAAEDRDFIAMNKITHVINCAGGEVADYFVGDPELKYLSFPWKDTVGSVCTTVLFDAADENINRAIQFIDEAGANGDCVLIHSFYGVSRSPVLIAAYFIVKYGWKLDSALAFLEMAHPDVSIKPHFLRQLRLFAKRHVVEHDVFDSTVDDSQFGLDNDQWMLRNTLLNGLAFEEQQANALYHQCTSKVEIGIKTSYGGTKQRKPRISFIDTGKGTDVAATSSTPVVGKDAHHVDPNCSADGTSFIGANGPVALQSGHRSPSILSRSTSPCTRRLESDPRSSPKGRQELPLIKAPGSSVTPEEGQSGAVVTPPANPVVEPQTVVRTNSIQSNRTDSDGKQVRVQPVQQLMGTANTDSNNNNSSSTGNAHSAGNTPSSIKGSYKRIAPPQGSTAAAHSPFATLTSNRKYRNGSPLPMKDKTNMNKKTNRTKILSSPSSRLGGSSSVTTSPHRNRPPTRTGSPASFNRSAGSPAVIARSASAGYKGIAPQRTGSRTRGTGSDAGSERNGPTSASSSARPSSPRGGRTRLRTSSLTGSESKLGSPRERMSGVVRTGSPSGKGTTAPRRKTSSSVDGRVPIAQRTSSPTGGSGSASNNNNINGSGSVPIRRQPMAAIPSRRQ